MSDDVRCPTIEVVKWVILLYDAKEKWQVLWQQDAPTGLIVGAGAWSEVCVAVSVLGELEWEMTEMYTDRMWEQAGSNYYAYWIISIKLNATLMDSDQGSF